MLKFVFLEVFLLSFLFLKLEVLLVIKGGKLFMLLRCEHSAGLDVLSIDRIHCMLTA